jgi:hypothetical protein
MNLTTTRVAAGFPATSAGSIGPSPGAVMPGGYTRPLTPPNSGLNKKTSGVSPT